MQESVKSMPNTIAHCVLVTGYVNNKFFEYLKCLILVSILHDLMHMNVCLSSFGGLISDNSPLVKFLVTFSIRLTVQRCSENILIGMKAGLSIIEKECLTAALDLYRDSGSTQLPNQITSLFQLPPLFLSVCRVWSMSKWLWLSKHV
jgi:hypothetical protein